MAPESPARGGSDPSSGLVAYQAENYRNWQVDGRESRIRKVRELIGRLPTGRLLDVGCSTGTVSGPLAAAGWEVFGLDIVDEPLLLARQAGLIVTAGDVTGQLPFASGSFDAVLAGEIIEHVVDTDGFLNELQRVLRPGGAMVLTTPNLASLENRMRLLFGIYPIWVDYRIGRGEGHVRAYTPRILERQVAEHGFVVEKRTGNYVPLLPQHTLNDVQAPWLARLGDWLPDLAMAIILLARKR